MVRLYETFDTLDAGTLNKTRVVDPTHDQAFQSVQAAHDDLPASGGTIQVAASLSETDITLSKPTRLAGAGIFDPIRSVGPAIDISGGRGIHVEGQAGRVVIENLALYGDDTNGAYGLKVGTNGSFESLNGCVLRNVLVAYAGGAGVVFEGQVTYATIMNLVAWQNNGDGVVFNPATLGDDWVNANTFMGVTATGNAGHGLHVPATAQGEVGGNDIRGLTVESNGGWGVRFDPAATTGGTTLAGYGCERNTQGALSLAAHHRHANASVHCQFRFLDGAVEWTGRGRAQAVINEDGVVTTYGAVRRPFGTIDFALKDDFGDARLTNRQRHASGVYIPTHGRVAGEGHVGRYRPEWRGLGFEESALGSATSDGLEAGTNTDSTIDSPAMTGRWEYDFSVDTLPSSGNMVCWLMWNKPTDSGYYIEHRPGGSLNLVAKDDDQYTLVVGGSWGPDTATHTVAAERDPDGSWRLDLDGTAVGSASHTWVPDAPVQLRYANWTDVPYTIHRLVVT